MSDTNASRHAQKEMKDFLETRSSHGYSLNHDDSLISFLNNDSGVSQLYLYSFKDNTKKQLTSYDNAISFGEFSPKENKLIFGMAEGGNENTQLYLLDMDTDTTILLTDKKAVQYKFGGWSYDGVSIMYAHNERNGTDFDIVIMNVKTGEVRTVFDQGGFCNPAGFSPDDRYAVIVKSYASYNRDLYLVDLNDDTTTLLTKHEGNAKYSMPHWLTDSSGFFVRTNENQDMVGVAFHDLKTNERTYRLNLKWECDELSLSEDGTQLAVVMNEDGYGTVELYNVSNFQILPHCEFPKGIMHGVQWSHDGKRLMFEYNNAKHNNDIYSWSQENNEITRITHSLCALNPEDLIEPELIHFPSFDGLEIPAFLYLPPINGDQKIPVIVNVHGGPEGQDRPTFIALTQYFLHQGYAVVRPNVRGSSGYGEKYMALDDREKRMDSVKDLEYLHKYLSNRSEIDSTKIALMGASYGGYMVLAGLAFQPNLWAAGIDIVGISHLGNFLRNTSSYRRAMREAEYGYLDTDNEFLERFSPLNSVDKIKAPLMVIHGANDPRVPLSEAQQIVDSLKARHVDVQFLVYDDEGHGLAKLKNRLDAY
ncbi:MAG: S9 family peptidase, partial [Patescibacteria group bacterium]